MHRSQPTTKHCSHKYQRKKIATADKAGCSYKPQHVTHPNRQHKVTVAHVSWGEAKQEGRKLVPSCWKQKWKFTLSLANFSKSFWETFSSWNRERREKMMDSRHRTTAFPIHRICKSLFYVCMFILACTQAASAGNWTQTHGHRSMYWVPPLVPKAAQMRWDSPESFWKVVLNRAATVRIQFKSRELAVIK